MPEEIRGSTKLGPISVDELHAAIGSARTAYTVKRWIIKGIPPVYDHVEASLDVRETERTGEIVQQLVGLQKKGLNVGVKIFPYGIPIFDGALLELIIEQSSEGA